MDVNTFLCTISGPVKWPLAVDNLEAPRAQILIGAQAPSNGVLTPVWQALYFVIHRANAVIDNSVNTQMDETLKARYIAEAKFLRAYAYYQLLGFWGGVPLMTNYAILLTDTKARSTEDEIYQFLITDIPTTFAGLATLLWWK